MCFASLSFSVEKPQSEPLSPQGARRPVASPKRKGCFSTLKGDAQQGHRSLESYSAPCALHRSSGAEGFKTPFTASPRTGTTHAAQRRRSKFRSDWLSRSHWLCWRLRVPPEGSPQNSCYLHGVPSTSQLVCRPFPEPPVYLAKGIKSTHGDREGEHIAHSTAFRPAGGLILNT